MNGDSIITTSETSRGSRVQGGEVEGVGEDFVIEVNHISQIKLIGENYSNSRKNETSDLMREEKSEEVLTIKPNEERKGISLATAEDTTSSDVNPSSSLPTLVALKPTSNLEVDSVQVTTSNPCSDPVEESTVRKAGNNELSLEETPCWSPSSSASDNKHPALSIQQTFHVYTETLLIVDQDPGTAPVAKNATTEERSHKQIPKSNESSRDSSADPAPSKSSLEDSFDSDSGSQHPAKSSRIPWTTRLLQKLTEEENTKKSHIQEVRVKRDRTPPKRSAIYERTDKTSPWLERSNKRAGQTYPPVPYIDLKFQGNISEKNENRSNKPQRDHIRPEAPRTSDDSVDSVDSGRRRSSSKDRYAELITELVLSQDEDNSITIGKHEEASVERGKEETTKKSPLRSLLPKGFFSHQSDPKGSKKSSTNTKRSPESGKNTDISPTRRPVLETAFVSHSHNKGISPERNKDLMFKKLEAKFTSSQGGFLRQKSLGSDAKPKISPKPDCVKSSIPRVSSNPKPSPEIYDNSDPIYANDVFFRKKRIQEVPEAYVDGSTQVDPRSDQQKLRNNVPSNENHIRNSQQYEQYRQVQNQPGSVIGKIAVAEQSSGRLQYPPGYYQSSKQSTRDSEGNYRQVGHPPHPHAVEYVQRGRTLSAPVRSSVEYRKDTQLEANKNPNDLQHTEQKFVIETNTKFNEYLRDYKDAHVSNRSSSSSTSTIVSEAPWHPDTVDLERTAISGSPEIRKLQQKQRPEYTNGEANRNSAVRALYYNEDQRLRSQVPLRIQTDNTDNYAAVDQRYQHASGRVSAPPVPYYEYSGRLQSPKTVKPLTPHHSSPKPEGENVNTVRSSPRRNIVVELSPHRHVTNVAGEKSLKYYSLDAPNLNINQRQSPNENLSGRLLVPVSAQVRISSAQQEFKRGESVQALEANLARGISPQQRQATPSSGIPVKVGPVITQKQQEAIYIERIQKANSLPSQSAPVDRLNRSFSPPGNYRKLSRQEVEQLYYQSQQAREMQAAQMSPNSAQRFRDQYQSTGSLKSSNIQRPESLSSPSNIHQSVSNLKTSPQQDPNMNRRPQQMYNVGPQGLLVKPQPMYNNPENSRIITINQQQYIQNMNNLRIRSRSVSPGPNSNMYGNVRSASLTRNPQQFHVSPQYPQGNPGHFVRGTSQRNTIGPIRTSQPQALQSTTIYENAAGVYDSDVELRHPSKLRNGIPPPVAKLPNGSGKAEAVKKESKDNNKKKDKKAKNKEKEKEKEAEKSKERPDQVYTPIFKRGSLVSGSTSSVDGSTTDSPSVPKRVSFSNGRDSVEQIYWPTRNGPAPEPPTRQHKTRPESSDSDVFLPNSPQAQYYQNGEYLYENVGQSSVYGVLNSSPSHDAPDRPLPPIPAHIASNYGIINRTRDLNSPASDSSRNSEKRLEFRRQGFESPGDVVMRRGIPAASSTSSLPAGVKFSTLPNRWQPASESESGSEAGEIQRILQQENRPQNYFRFPEEEWGVDGKPRGPPGSDQSASSSSGRGGGDDEVRRGGSGRGSRRDEPRRHTLSGDHHQGHHGSLARSMDLEMSSKQRRKSPLPRGYPPPSSAMLFDDDPGIMSEVETSSTGFHRGGKQRSSLPVVRTPSKTLERPLGLVFLQYRNETKRALLPNEITSLDTVRALFVRSFPKQLNMEYLDSHMVKIYIHDSSKDMFYELEDLRTHLRDIRDRSVLRLFESADVNGGVLPGAGVGVTPPVWDQDQSYFSEPEFDSEYQHQHIHKSKSSSKSSGGQPYYMTHSYPPGGAPASATLPRGGSAGLRAYSPAVPPPLPADRIKTLPQADRLHSESGYMSSPERGGSRGGGYTPGYIPGGSQGAYEDPYYSQYPRSGSITPVIDEEARACLSRIRVEHMERQLANLTGLVQKALTHSPTPREYLQVPTSGRDANYRNDEAYLRTDTKPPKLGKDKSVSFEKSVSFSDEPPDMNSPKQHSPQHAERTERESRHKPPPPPKPVSLAPAQYDGRHIYRDLQLTPEMYNQLRGLQKKAKDLRSEVRNLRRMSQAQAHSVRETIRDTFIKIRAMLISGGADAWSNSGDHEKSRLSREEEIYKQEMIRLENDLTELEQTVEELRGNVINRKTRVNMSDVENMALILSKSSKTVADLKVRFPGLQEGMKGLLSLEMEKVVREEKFLVEEPERLESALRRCKKLTGTLVTLKRLASVQEQRLPPSTTPEARLSPTLGDSDSTPPITPPAHGKAGAISARSVLAAGGSADSISWQRPENALDALLDELQTFARPPSNPSLSDIGRKGSIDSQQNLPNPQGTLRRLHSYPSSSDGGGNSPPTLSRLQVSNQTEAGKSPKPPVPERNAELLAQVAGRRVPPPPPPRTSSRSPLASPTSPSLPPRGTPSQPQMGTLRRGAPGRSSLREPLRGNTGLSEAKLVEEMNPGFNPLSASNSSSCESVNSQEGVQSKSGSKQRQEVLEQRHQELLRKQRALQEQYARLQQLQRGSGGLSVPPQPDLLQLKKTGSESNLLAKMGLGHNLSAAAPISGSLTHLAVSSSQPITAQSQVPQLSSLKLQIAPNSTSTTNKVYETDIL